MGETRFGAAFDRLLYVCLCEPRPIPGDDTDGAVIPLLCPTHGQPLMIRHTPADSENESSAREYAQRWRDDAFEAAAKIAERYGMPGAAEDIRVLIRAPVYRATPQVEPERLEAPRVYAEEEGGVAYACIWFHKGPRFRCHCGNGTESKAIAEKIASRIRAALSATTGEERDIVGRVREAPEIDLCWCLGECECAATPTEEDEPDPFTGSMEDKCDRCGESRRWHLGTVKCRDHGGTFSPSESESRESEPQAPETETET